MNSRALVSLLIISLALSAAAQNWLDAQPRPAETQGAIDETLYLTSGEALKRASLGFDGLLADIYWIRTIEYFGANFERQKAAQGFVDIREMRRLEPLLEITTELNPNHIAAYRFGAFFLPYLDPEKATSFVNRGIRNNPNEWRLYQDLGFIYWRRGRYREASEAYMAGSQVTGAPAWMEAMAATMLASGGERETAREIFERLCEGSDDRFIKQLCEEDDPAVQYGERKRPELR
jgi:tetratricopeptide (TPR) repeat protein